MAKKICRLLLIILFSSLVSGCALIPLAISAGVSYGIYQATR